MVLPVSGSWLIISQEGLKGTAFIYFLLCVTYINTDFEAQSGHSETENQAYFMRMLNWQAYAEYRPAGIQSIRLSSGLNWSQWSYAEWQQRVDLTHFSFLFWGCLKWGCTTFKQELQQWWFRLCPFSKRAASLRKGLPGERICLLHACCFQVPSTMPSFFLHFSHHVMPTTTKCRTKTSTALLWACD